MARVEERVEERPQAGVVGGHRLGEATAGCRVGIQTGFCACGDRRRR